MPLTRPRRTFLVALILAVALLLIWWRTGRRRQFDSLQVPDGFRIALYGDSVAGARSLTLGSAGTVFVGTRDQGVIYALPDANHDNIPDRVVTFARGLETPNGVAFKDGALYVAETGRILRYDSAEARLDHAGPPAIVFPALPTDPYHGWRYLRAGPDGRLYVSVGTPCNVCATEDSLFATILSLNTDGTDLRIEARGVRNSVGFDWHPVTGALWFTDNGRDWMGENEPPDELNRRSRRGEHFGYPHCFGKSLRDSEFGKDHPCGNYVAPFAELGAHVASLGMRFYTGAMFPARYRNRVFIAEHGSWNRLILNGYRVTTVAEEDGKPDYQTFARGWERLNRSWGRPVDLLQMPDGALLVSDDQAGVIYRISYGE
jgi:glucose/arabinose dehydrogenase